MLSCALTHSWDLTPKAARDLQDTLKAQVCESPLSKPVKTIAGVDVSIKGQAGRAAVILLKWPALEPVCNVAVEGRVTWPYVQGLLAFREIPLILCALGQLDELPDLIMTDGHGRAHPRRFGLACHLGLLLNVPTLGVAKRRFIGVHEMPHNEKGSHVPLVDPKTGDVLGAVVRTRSRVSPVYVSCGHAITLVEGIEFTIKSAVRYRVPEPTRLAHLESRRWSAAMQAAFASRSRRDVRQH